MPTRRELLLQASFFSAIAASIGCGTNESSGGPKPERLPRPVRSEIEQYYPELRDVKPVEQGFFTVGERKITWFNFTENYTFDEDAAQQLYGYYRLFAHASAKGPLIEAASGRQISFSVGTKAVRNDAILFIVKRPSPDPYWDTIHRLGVTRIDLGGKPDLMKVKVTDDTTTMTSTERTLYETPELLTTATIATEICHSSVLVSTELRQVDELAQELFCNIIARAISFRAANVPYETYRRAFSPVVSRVVGGSYRENPFPEGDYETIPMVPMALRRR